MHCRKARDLIARYVDRSLPEPLQIAMDEHLRACDSCKTTYQHVLAVAGVFAQTSVPAVPEGLLDAILVKVARGKTRDIGKQHRTDTVAGWWAMATPGVRVAYALMLAMLTAGGAYMGHDLWWSRARTDVVVSYETDYPGTDAFVAMQRGSIEQAYFDLTSYGTERTSR
jgi:anti-sigma factor RsiW